MEGADVELVFLGLFDDSGADLLDADHGYAGEDDVLGEGGEEGFLDVEAVLYQDDDRVSGRHGRGDQFCHRGRAVGDVLGRADYVVVRRETFGGDIWYRADDYNDVGICC